MRKIVLTIIGLCVLCVGVLHAQNTKALTSTGHLDTLRNTGAQTKFVSSTGELGSTPKLSRTGSLLTASAVSVSASNVATCSISADYASMTATVGNSGDYLRVITERGVCYGTTANPTLSDNKVVAKNSGNGQGEYQVEMSGLAPNTTYHARAYAISDAGTVYGDDVTFTTHPRSYCTGLTPMSNESSDASGIYAVRDHEGNSYPVVQIGSHCWIAENLRTTSSPSTGSKVVVSAPYRSFTSKAAFWYEHDSATYAPQHYGLLYNFCAAMDTFLNGYSEVANGDELDETWYPLPVLNLNAAGHRQGICPKGWHVPSKEDIQTLQEESGAGNGVPGAGKLAGGCSWISSDINTAPGNYDYADRNSSGFTLLPAGLFNEGVFEGIGKFSYLGMSTIIDWADSNSKPMKYMYLEVKNDKQDSWWAFWINRYAGFSIRCLRD